MSGLFVQKSFDVARAKSETALEYALHSLNVVDAAIQTLSQRRGRGVFVFVNPYKEGQFFGRFLGYRRRKRNQCGDGRKKAENKHFAYQSYLIVYGLVGSFESCLRKSLVLRRLNWRGIILGYEDSG